MPSPKCVAADVRRLTLKSEIGNLKSEIARASYSENGIGGNARPHPAFAGRSQSGHLQQNCYGGRRPGPLPQERRNTTAPGIFTPFGVELLHGDLRQLLPLLTGLGRQLQESLRHLRSLAFLLVLEK